ncbi:ABC1 kinase family protein [Paraurantiacibacter namhicola]|nr:AarF/ABC1/UbiB kinase family protein [Paraurantiacibacter namhicola]
MARDTSDTDDEFEAYEGKAIPSGRGARFTHFGALASGVAGGMLAEGARRLAAGERPRMRDMMLTPGNVMRVADKLSHLRGAAMKLGQMVSMDAGDFLPPELSAIMARLRENADHMPPGQLNKVLIAEWGKGWRRQFTKFGPKPMAAASIGQVHRAILPDGRELAIKVQYPGVATSIDSDIDNVATLLRISGLLPKELDIAPLLAEAKRQLHEEADYQREAAMMTRYANLLEGEDSYLVPRPVEALTTDKILAMDFLPGEPIEALESAPQEVRDTAMESLIGLVLRELFEFGLMQTDPNFANYRFDPESGRLVLLDFGATRELAPDIVDAYRQMLRAGLGGDKAEIRAAAVAAGFMNDAAARKHQVVVDDMIDVILAEANKPGKFDFGDRAFIGVLREQGMSVAEDREAWHLPPAEMVFVQRKISGTALLAARLKARVDVRGMIADALERYPAG